MSITQPQGAKGILGLTHSLISQSVPIFSLQIETRDVLKQCFPKPKKNLSVWLFPGLPYYIYFAKREIVVYVPLCTVFNLFSAQCVFVRLVIYRLVVFLYSLHHHSLSDVSFCLLTLVFSLQITCAPAHVKLLFIWVSVCSYVYTCLSHHSSLSN